MPALFMKSQTQTARHTMEALTFVFPRLSNADHLTNYTMAVVVVAFSSRARILGECSTIHSATACVRVCACVSFPLLSFPLLE